MIQFQRASVVVVATAGPIEPIESMSAALKMAFATALETSRIAALRSWPVMVIR